MGSKVLRSSAVVAAVAVASLLALVVTGLAGAVWTHADKDGFGTSTTPGSKVWYTLNNGALTEVYYPDLDTPSVRDLQFIVSDGRTFAERETEITASPRPISPTRSARRYSST